MVAVRARVFASDEELGKRDDDRRPGKMNHHWSIKHKPAWRKRRIFFILLACVGVWLFIHYIPTDLGPVDRVTGRRLPNPRAQQPPPPPPPTKQTFDDVRKSPDTQPPPPPPPPDDEGPGGPPPRDFDGPIRFYYLASTLRAAKRAKELEDDDKDVLFAASNLNSAGAIIPMACEMASWKRNTVHMAILGRSEIPLEEIKSMNRVPQESCDIRWHDARPDFVATSTEARMEVSVAGALGHIDNFIHPVAVITADFNSEDIFFALGMGRKMKQIYMTHIQVPKDSPESLAWAARLDAASLKSWHSASIDVLVQAPLDSSGSLIRLLKSLAQADYSGFNPPRLTIELPHSIDDMTMNFLGRFRWPPPRYASLGQNEQLTIRRRIFEQRLSVDDASQRFIESFYPSSPKGPHILLLSPQAELSPIYFHYLKLNVLEYRHSSSITEVERDLFGISLESPSVNLDGKTPFQPPLTSNAASSSTDNLQPTPFRWQAPNTNAALYFGDKWMEAHSFLMKRRSATRRPTLQAHYRNEQKVVSEKSPAWAEYFLQLMRNRAYFFQYPGLQLSSALAVVHNELYQVPEEFARFEDNPKQNHEAPSSESILTVKDDYLDSHHPLASHPKALNVEGPLAQDLNHILPTLPPPMQRQKEGQAETPDMIPISPAGQKSLPAMQRLSTLPLLDHLGKPITLENLQENAKSVRASFRSGAGGCSTEQIKRKELVTNSAQDLFCFDDAEDDVPTSSPSQVTQELPPPDNAAQPPTADKVTQIFPPLDNAAKPPNAKAPMPPESGAGIEQQQQLPPPPPPQPKVETVPVNYAAPAAAPAAAPVDNAAAAEAERFREAARENFKKLGAAARIPGVSDPAADSLAKPEVPAVANAVPAPAEAAAALEPGPVPNEAPAFPVLDPSKLKAFDEGREAERDVPVIVDDEAGAADAADNGDVKEP